MRFLDGFFCICETNHTEERGTVWQPLFSSRRTTIPIQFQNRGLDAPKSIETTWLWLWRLFIDMIFGCRRQGKAQCAHALHPAKTHSLATSSLYRPHKPMHNKITYNNKNTRQMIAQVTKTRAGLWFLDHNRICWRQFPPAIARDFTNTKYAG